MAKITAEKATANQTKIKLPDTSDVSEILQRLEQLEQSNKDKDKAIEELKKGKVNPIKAAKEKYEGPLHFNYKMWAGVPILSYVSKKKDPSRDFIFKNNHNVWESNHYVVAQLADGEEVEIEQGVFSNSFTRSDKLPAKDQNGNSIDTDSKLSKLETLTFDHSEYGEITVLYSAIN